MEVNKKLLAKLLIAVCTVLAFSVIHLANKNLVLAQTDAFPGGGKIPCDAPPSDPEFSSDRPYQASPCGDAPKTYSCGNTIVVSLGTVTTDYCNAETCPYKGTNPINKHVVVDLTDVELPILGNTELTKNSQSASDLEDSAKVNEYASWYLNGVTATAENGEVDESKLADYSGPIKKLLPGAILDAKRVVAIETGSKETTYTDDESGETITDKLNHDQIVVCESGGKAVECYKGDGSKTQGNEMRLTDWGKGNLSIFNTFVDWLGADQWKKRIPPLPWQFEKDIYYEKAYNEWRGKSCAILPVFGLRCIENLFVPNKYADLFQYVPLANTTDKKGANVVNNVHVSSNRATLEVPVNKTTGQKQGYEINHSPQLYDAHTQEVLELANTLQSTYKGKDSQKSGGDVALPDVESEECRLINTRSNPGDDATFTTPRSYLEVDVHYNVIDVKCTPPKPPKFKCDPKDPTDCGFVEVGECKAEIFATMPLNTKTPNADEIWNSTVAGPEAIFRRIYPKVDENAPVSCIANMAASSKATYTLSDESSPSVDNLKAQNPGDSPAGSPEVYFPHFGSVYEYFLKGIQTSLRPKELGDSQPVSSQYCDNIKCGELPKTLPKASGSCSLGNIGLNVPPALKDIVNAAAETYKTPPSLILGIMYGEGLFEKGRFNWTDQNVKNWATCQKVPNCHETGDDNFMGFNGNDFANIAPHILPDLQKLDPNKKTLSQCNLMDAIYAEAWNLHDSADGGGGIPSTCFGINLGGSIPTSCAWDNGQYAAAIKIAENGYEKGCFTLKNSCLTGGGNSALCTNGVDGCETINNRYSGEPSHFACIWDKAVQGGSGTRR